MINGQCVLPGELLTFPYKKIRCRSLIHVACSGLVVGVVVDHVVQVQVRQRGGLLLVQLDHARAVLALFVADIVLAELLLALLLFGGAGNTAPSTAARGSLARATLRLPPSSRCRRALAPPRRGPCSTTPPRAPHLRGRLSAFLVRAVFALLALTVRSGTATGPGGAPARQRSHLAHSLLLQHQVGHEVLGCRLHEIPSRNS